jgi:regulator of sigma E protease
MQTIIAFLIVLGVLIFAHELGHFLAARRLGVKVLKFSLGFGPKLIGKKIGDTEYLISIFPLGGYVKLLGEDSEESTPSGETVPLSEEDRARSFAFQPLWKRVVIVAAGPLFNLVLAYFIFVAFLSIGFPMYVPQFEALLPVVETVVEGSPAMEAGIKAGDKVLSIEGQKITTWNQMTEIIRNSPEKPLILEVERGGKTVKITVVPGRKTITTPEGEEIEIGQIGVSKELKGAEIEASNPVIALYKGMEATWEWTKLTVVGIWKLIARQISAENIGGPILIAQMSGRAASEGIISTAMFIAILSINLGVINLLPVPILDGGHLFFFLIEAVLGRPLSVRKREIMQQVGLYLLILLMGLALYNDVVRLFAV